MRKAVKCFRKKEEETMLSVAKMPVISLDKNSTRNERIFSAAFGAESCAHFLSEAAAAIRSSNYGLARDLLKQYMSNDMENPEAYNLLGISYEIEGDRLKAARFYRVAYYMDQTFAAPSENLNRVGTLWYKGKQGISWGLERIKGNS